MDHPYRGPWAVPAFESDPLAREEGVVDEELLELHA
jgi:hypothetical protein